MLLDAPRHRDAASRSGDRDLALVLRNIHGWEVGCEREQAVKAELAEIGQRGFAIHVPSASTSHLGYAIWEVTDKGIEFLHHMGTPVITALAMRQWYRTHTSPYPTIHPDHPETTPE